METAESELKAIEAKNKEMLRALPDATFVLDAKGNYLDFHIPNAMSNLFPSETLTGKNISEVMPEEISRKTVAHLVEIQKTGKIQVFETCKTIKQKMTYFENRIVTCEDGNLLLILRDITHQKQVSEELLQEKVMAQKYLDTAASIFLVIKRDHTVELINQKGCQVLGYQENEVKGKSWFDYFIPAADRQQVTSVFNQLMKGQNESLEFYENKVITKGKKERIIQWHNTILKDDNGKPIATLSSGVDITEKKEIEKTLHTRNKALEAAFNGIIIADARLSNQPIIYANQAFTRLTGYNQEEILGKNCRFLQKDDIDQPEIKAMNEAIEMGRSCNVVLRNYRKDGSLFWNDVGITTVHDENGQLTHFIGVLNDITHRRENLEKLKKSEDRLSLVLEATSGGLWDWDIKTGKVFFSHQWMQSLGYSPGEVQPHVSFWNSIVHPDDIPKVQEALKAHFKGESEIYRCENRLKNKAGEWRWNLDEGRVVEWDNKGNPLRMVGSDTDITARKKEELLKDEMGKVLEMITKNQPVQFIGGQIVKTVENQIENCTGAILVIDPEDHSMRTLAAPNIPKATCQVIEAIYMSAQTSAGKRSDFLSKEMIFSDIANDPVWKEYKQHISLNTLKACWSIPFFSSNGQVLGVFALLTGIQTKPAKNEMDLLTDAGKLTSVAIEKHRVDKHLKTTQQQLKEYAIHLEEQVDQRTRELNNTVSKLVDTNLTLEDQITETKIAETKAWENQALFSAIAQYFPNGAIVVINRNCEIEFLDGEEIRKLKVDRESLEGMKIEEVTIISSKEKEWMSEYIERTFKGSHLSYETEFRGGTYLVNTMPMFDEKSKVNRVLFVYNNITKRKKAEMGIVKALEKERELNELKSRFITTASHEFRTPLSTILTSANLIARQNESGFEKKREKNVDRIKSNVKNLVGILDDFLSLGKLEEGKLTFRPEEFDLIDFVKSIIAELEGYKKEGQLVSLESNKEIIFVTLDKQIIKNVLLNLLSNALKYSPGGKTVVISINADDSSLMINITDQGIGIPLEEQQNLFQRFFRARNATNIQGTGLGLHIVKRYVDFMDGAITFKSEPFHGTTFIVSLPLKQKDYEKDIAY